MMIEEHKNTNSGHDHDDGYHHDEIDDINNNQQQLGLRRRVIPRSLHDGESSSSSLSLSQIQQQQQQHYQQQQQVQVEVEVEVEPTTKLPPPYTSFSTSSSSSPSVAIGNTLTTATTIPPPTSPSSSPSSSPQQSCKTTTTAATSTFTSSTVSPTVSPTATQQQQEGNLYTFSTDSPTGRILTYITHKIPLTSTRSGSALPGFLSLLLLTMANYMLSPMRDAAALAVGVSHIPTLTLASTILALASSVPMGWLFEAPNPERKGRRWRDRVGLTRGETQGTSLALFLRCFAICLVGYALTFKVLEWFDWDQVQDLGGGGGVSGVSDGGVSDSNDYDGESGSEASSSSSSTEISHGLIDLCTQVASRLLHKFGKVFYVAFFLVVHLMKLHSLSLIWGVTSEAMEYEEQAENRERRLRLRMRQQMALMRKTGSGSGSGSGSGNDLNINRSNSGSGQMYEGSVNDNENLKEQDEKSSSSGKQSRVRLKRLAFVGFGGTLGGILGSVFVSMTAHSLRLSGLLIVAAILLLLSAELSIEMGQIMLRHWEEEQNEKYHYTSSDEDLVSLGQSQSQSQASTTMDQHSHSHSHSHNHQIVGDAFSTSSATATNHGDHSSSSSSGINININGGLGLDSSMKRVNSFGMKKSASGVSINSLNSMSNMASLGGGHGGGGGIDTCMKRVTSSGSMKRVASGNSIASIRRAMSSQNSLAAMAVDSKGKAGAGTAGAASTEKMPAGNVIVQNVHIQPNSNVEAMAPSEDNTFKQRLLRGITTILRSRLLMTIFTYNALYATTTTLLSFQRAELVANRSSVTTSMDSDTAFLARINIISSVAVFALQASGLGAFIASGLGQRGTLSLMPIVRMMGVAMLVLWHIKQAGQPPNLTFFLVLDEFTKVINFAVAKPVRESLWRGLSNEARYEAKPIVDTLANRWGSGSAAFLMSLLDRIMLYSGLGEQLEDGTKSLFGFPPLLILCAIAAAWWAFVSADLGNIRHRIDLELKKQQ